MMGLGKDILNEGVGTFLDTIADVKLRDRERKKRRLNAERQFRLKTALDLAQKARNVDLLQGLTTFTDTGQLDDLIAEQMPAILDDYAARMKKEDKKKYLFDLLRAKQENAAKQVGIDAGIPGAEYFDVPVERKALAGARAAQARANIAREQKIKAETDLVRTNLEIAKAKLDKTGRDAAITAGTGGMRTDEIKSYVDELNKSDTFLERQEKAILNTLRQYGADSLEENEKTPAIKEAENALNAVRQQRSRLRKIQNVIIGLQEERVQLPNINKMQGPPVPPDLTVSPIAPQPAQQQAQQQAPRNDIVVQALQTQAKQGDRKALLYLLDLADRGDYQAYLAVKEIMEGANASQPANNVQGPPPISQ